MVATAVLFILEWTAAACFGLAVFMGIVAEPSWFVLALIALAAGVVVRDLGRLRGRRLSSDHALRALTGDKAVRS